MELIPIIINENNEQLVRGRDLYDVLEVKDNYTD